DVIGSTPTRMESLGDDGLAQHHLCCPVIGPRRSNHVLFDHRAPEIVRAIMQPEPANIQALSKPRNLHVRYVVQVEACYRKPSDILVAGNPVRESLADGSVVGLERPWNERHKSGLRVLKLAQPLQMHQPVIARLSVPEHHRGRSRYSEAMRHP